MKEMLIKFGLFCFVVIVAAIIAPKTPMEGDFFILAGLGIVIVQNMFIRWALAAQQDKAEEAAQGGSLRPTGTLKQ